MSGGSSPGRAINFFTVMSWPFPPGERGASSPAVRGKAVSIPGTMPD